MNYVTSILVEDDNSERLRAFESEEKARGYVERLANRLFELNEKDKTRMYVSIADVFIILPSGVMRQVAHFDGNAGSDGYWHGWSDEK